jgi:hypothetical protein
MYYRSLQEVAREVESRVTARLRNQLQTKDDARRDCGLAFDGADAAEIYANALDHVGVPRSETTGLDARSLALIWRQARRGSWTSRGMAFDAQGVGPALASIFKEADARRVTR